MDQFNLPAKYVMQRLRTIVDRTYRSGGELAEISFQLPRHTHYLCHFIEHIVSPKIAREIGRDDFEIDFDGLSQQIVEMFPDDGPVDKLLAKAVLASGGSIDHAIDDSIAEMFVDRGIAVLVGEDFDTTETRELRHYLHSLGDGLWCAVLRMGILDYWMEGDPEACFEVGYF